MWKAIYVRYISNAFFTFCDRPKVVEEGFLEDVNNILSSGQVPNLYRPEEFEEIKGALGEIARKQVRRFYFSKIS